MQDKGQAKGSVAHNSTLLVAAREVKSMLSSNPSRQVGGDVRHLLASGRAATAV